jgi:hypothetical protein
MRDVHRIHFFLLHGVRGVTYEIFEDEGRFEGFDESVGEFYLVPLVGPTHWIRSILLIGFLV